VSLGGFTYDNDTKFLLPKITVFTGLGNQTVKFDSIEFTQAVPEPSIAFLFLVGLGVLWSRRGRWQYSD
jgi:hypothetical protein